ncbi:MAG: hypothetical protein WC082_14845, partial [Victivallales bacterium]
WLSAGNTGSEEDYLNWLRTHDGSRHEFTQDDLTDNTLSVDSLLNIVAVADNDGVQWELPQNSVTYGSNSAVVDLSGIMAMKNITAITGTWELILGGGDKGEKGDTGETGTQGEQGIQGETGAQGEKGDDGDSAYQVWLDAGNTGTEADFLAALKGDKGDAGDTGAQGEQGIQGETGAQGEKGDDGDSAYDLWIAAGNTGTEADFLAYVNGEKVRVNQQTGTSYTPVLSDAGKIIEMNNADANTVTLPLYANTAFEADMVFAIDRMGAGQTAISCDATATINGTAGATVYILTQYCGVSVRVLSADNWLIQGDVD